MSPKVPQNPPADPALSLDEVLLAAEACYRKILREELDAILAPILKKLDEGPSAQPPVVDDSPCPP